MLPRAGAGADSHTLGDLLGEYNRRIGAVETDKSLLIEIPAALGGPEEEE